MNRVDVANELTTLSVRSDLPDDARSALREQANKILKPLDTDVWIYRMVVIFLGVVVLATVFGGIYIAAFVSTAGTPVTIPEAIVAIGSASVGALAGLLAPSPTASS